MRELKRKKNKKTELEVRPEPRRIRAITLGCDEKLRRSMEDVNRIYPDLHLLIYDSHTELYAALQVLNEKDMNLLFILVDAFAEEELGLFELDPYFQNSLVIISSDKEWAVKMVGSPFFAFLNYPLKMEELRDCVRRYKNQKENLLKESFSAFSKEVLLINRHDRTLFVSIDQIIRLEAKGSYTDIHLEGGGKINTSKNLMHYEEMLAAHMFYKVHRSHLVSLLKIKELLKTEGDGVLILKDGSRVGVSRSKKNEFLRRMIQAL